MMIYRSFGLTIAELWFDEPVPLDGIDIIRYRQRSEPLPGGTNSPFITLVEDLNRSTDDIFAGMDMTTRKGIRRARDRDGIECKPLDTGDDSLKEFCSVYDAFALQKGLSPSDTLLLARLRQNGMLDMSVAGTPEHGALVYRVHVVCRGRARQRYSVSLFRQSTDKQFKNFVGRANRYLHWHDMLRFKKNGIMCYDFGGWYEGIEDKEKLSINEFKEAFGGHKRCDFNGEVPVTTKAKLFIIAARLIGRRR